MKTYFQAFKRLLAVGLMMGLTGVFPYTANGQTSYPMLMSLKPVAAQVGQTSEHVVSARYSVHDAYQVLVSGEGVKGELVPPAKKQKRRNSQTVKVRFEVAPDAAEGVREFRLATPRGVSTIGQLVIVRDRVIAETAKNNAPDQAQRINVPSTLCGAVERAEDVDYYRFDAPAGAALSFHVRSMRLQDKIHDLQRHIDPILTLKNAAGVTLASSDNFFYGDSFIGYRFSHAGEYLLEIRDVRYHGNSYWEYCIEISDRPFVTNVYPLAVERGQTAHLSMIGFHLPQNQLAKLSIPMQQATGLLWRPLTAGDAQTNPIPLFVTEHKVEQESDENNNVPQKALPVSAPGGINGRIDEPGDLDCFAFDAKKGQRFSFEVVARRMQSSLDSHLRILDEKGKQLRLNDDMRLGKRTYADSWIENWAAPKDGKYVIEIRDLHLRGGPSFVYFLKITRSEPYFELYADTDKTQLTPGTGGIVFVRAARKNGFSGTVQLHVDSLPSGVTADCGRILPGGEDGCIVFHAARDAKIAVANVNIRGTSGKLAAVDAGPTLLGASGARRLASVDAQYYQETYRPGGGRGHWPVSSHTVAVGAPGDILDVSLSDDQITLRPGQSKKVDVVIQRAKGFNKNVTLDVIYKHLSTVYGNSLPKGVSLDAGASKTLLTGGAVKGHITLKAAPNAPPVEKQQIAVMASVSINFVMKSTYASQPLLVTVKK